MLAFAEGNLWAASRRSLSHLDPTSLQSIGTIPIAGSIVDLAATEERLWVFTDQAVVGLDPSDGEELARYSIDGITNGAVAPDGQRLYVSLDRPVRRDHLPVLELDPNSSGSIVARTRSGYADLTGISGLTATDEGVWISFATGNMGFGVFARACDVKQPSGDVTNPENIDGTNSIR